MPTPSLPGLRPSAPLGAGTAGAAPRRTKRPEDTVAGCEARAASDLTSAAATGTVNGRLKLEHSAAVWRGRAAMLQRMATSFAKRKALDTAEKDRAADAEALAGGPS